MDYCRSKARACDEEMQLDFLLHELSECRQDDRDSINQILSVIGAGIAAVVIVADVLTNGGGEGVDGRVMDALKCIAPWILFGIVVTAFSYVLSIGTRSSLRYSYMRLLYRKIKDCGVDFPGWVEMSAPLITLNPRHIKSSYTLIHFLGIFCAIVAAIAVCSSAIAISVIGNGLRLDVLAAVALYFILFMWAVSAMSDASAMMAKIEALGKERRKQAESSSKKNDNEERGWPSFLLYLVYPHPQDALKLLFLVFGYALGWFISGESRPLPDLLSRSALLVGVFDVLGYQARYQINDIRGYDEDEKNPAAEKRGRLASYDVPEPVKVRVSATVALVKIALGVAVSIYMSPGDNMRMTLLTSFALIFLLAIAYECARSPWNKSVNGKELHKILPIALVGLGYLLRIGAGIVCAGGTNALLPDSPASVAIYLVLAASVPFGWSFVGITWMLECCAGRYNTGEAYHKDHIEYLYKKACNRGSEPGYDPASYYRPLKRRDSFRNIWNWALTASVVLMAAAALLLRATLAPDFLSGQLDVGFALIAAILLLLFVEVVGYLVCPGSDWVLKAASWPVIVICVGWIGWLLHEGNLRGCACPAVFLGAAVYILICLNFKRTNYFEMADFAKGIRYTLTVAPRALFGRLFKWPKNEGEEREAVKSVKKDLDGLNEGDSPETSETKAKREKHEKDLEAALRVYVHIFKSGNAEKPKEA